MKKLLAIAFLALSSVVVFGPLMTLVGLEKTYEYDLSGYSGMILPSDKARPPVTLTIHYSMDETLKWGPDAIMSYDETAKELHVWRPDQRIPGVFQESSFRLNEYLWHFFEMNVDIPGKKIYFQTHYPFRPVICLCFVLIILFIRLGVSLDEASIDGGEK